MYEKLRKKGWLSLIITAKFDPKSIEVFSSLRSKYFPVDRNIVPAHLTLFHNVPEESRSLLELPEFPLKVRFGAPYFLGKGFAVEVTCPELSKWRNRVLKLPIGFTPQDMQKKRLHITIQNKVDPEVAKREFALFKSTWVEFEGTITELEYWKYLNGPWAPL